MYLLCVMQESEHFHHEDFCFLMKGKKHPCFANKKTNTFLGKRLCQECWKHRRGRNKNIQTLFKAIGL